MIFPNHKKYFQKFELSEQLDKHERMIHDFVLSVNGFLIIN